MGLDKINTALAKYAKYSDLPLRIVIGMVFITAGAGKLFGGIDGFTGMLAGLGFGVTAGLFAWLVALIEFVGGIAILAGWQTRIFALLLAIIMVVAIVMVKLPTGFAAATSDIVLLGVSLTLAFAGSKSLCVDKQ